MHKTGNSFTWALSQDVKKYKEPTIEENKPKNHPTLSQFRSFMKFLPRVTCQHPFHRWRSAVGCAGNSGNQGSRKAPTAPWPKVMMPYVRTSRGDNEKLQGGLIRLIADQPVKRSWGDRIEVDFETEFHLKVVDPEVKALGFGLLSNGALTPLQMNSFESCCLSDPHFMIFGSVPSTCFCWSWPLILFVWACVCICSHMHILFLFIVYIIRFSFFDMHIYI